VCLGRDVRVGGECRLHEGVVVRHGCTLGERVEIGPNSVIGQDGFGYYFQDGAHHKVPHIGTVVIEDDVEIGACSCVDRAKFGATRIGAGTKIDNLVQIAHNVETGRGCLLAGQVGIAGSARLGDTVVLGGHAGVRDNIRLGDGVQAAAFSAVAGDIEAGQVVGGVPARPVREQMRAVHAAAKTPEMAKKLRDLQARIERLESAADHS
jgi:UDP-3-O-[3-hydroxymyristoyl] glucosamine N-acyltransferase